MEIINTWYSVAKSVSPNLSEENINKICIYFDQLKNSYLDNFSLQDSMDKIVQMQSLELKLICDLFTERPEMVIEFYKEDKVIEDPKLILNTDGSMTFDNSNRDTKCVIKNYYIEFDTEQMIVLDYDKQMDYLHHLFVDNVKTILLKELNDGPCTLIAAGILRDVSITPGEMQIRLKYGIK